MAGRKRGRPPKSQPLFRSTSSSGETVMNADTTVIASPSSSINGHRATDSRSHAKRSPAVRTSQGAVEGSESDTSSRSYQTVDSTDEEDEQALNEPRSSSGCSPRPRPRRCSDVERMSQGIRKNVSISNATSGSELSHSDGTTYETDEEPGLGRWDAKDQRDWREAFYADDDEVEYHVERVLDWRRHPRKGYVEYRIKWKDFSDLYDTWEPGANFNSRTPIERFWKEYKRKAVGERPHDANERAERAIPETERGRDGNDTETEIRKSSDTECRRKALGRKRLDVRIDRAIVRGDYSKHRGHVEERRQTPLPRRKRKKHVIVTLSDQSDDEEYRASSDESSDGDDGETSSQHTRESSRSTVSETASSESTPERTLATEEQRKDYIARKNLKNSREYALSVLPKKRRIRKDLVADDAQDPSSVQASAEPFRPPVLPTSSTSAHGVKSSDVTPLPVRIFAQTANGRATGKKKYRNPLDRLIPKSIPKQKTSPAAVNTSTASGSFSQHDDSPGLAQSRQASGDKAVKKLRFALEHTITDEETDRVPDEWGSEHDCDFVAQSDARHDFDISTKDYAEPSNVYDHDEAVDAFMMSNDAADAMPSPVETDMVTSKGAPVTREVSDWIIEDEDASLSHIPRASSAVDYRPRSRPGTMTGGTAERGMLSPTTRAAEEHQAIQVGSSSAAHSSIPHLDSGVSLDTTREFPVPESNRRRSASNEHAAQSQTSTSTKPLSFTLREGLRIEGRYHIVQVKDKTIRDDLYYFINAKGGGWQPGITEKMRSDDTRSVIWISSPNTPLGDMEREAIGRHNFEFYWSDKNRVVREIWPFHSGSVTMLSFGALLVMLLRRGEKLAEQGEDGESATQTDSAQSFWTTGSSRESILVHPWQRGALEYLIKNDLVGEFLTNVLGIDSSLDDRTFLLCMFGMQAMKEIDEVLLEHTVRSRTRKLSELFEEDGISLRTLLFTLDEEVHLTLKNLQWAWCAEKRAFTFVLAHCPLGENFEYQTCKKILSDSA